MAITTIRRPTLRSSYTDGRAKRADADADAIRSRFLFRLGIYDPNFTNASIRHKIRTVSKLRRQLENPAAQAQRDDDQELAPYFAPLKVDPDSHGCDEANLPLGYARDPLPSMISLSEDESVTSASTDPQEPTRRPRRSSYVQFDPSVSVVPIPSHRSYPPQVLERLYTPKQKIVHDAARNNREFMYERWDWREAVEEQEMYICKHSGEYVHPAHVVGRRATPFL